MVWFHLFLGSGAVAQIARVVVEDTILDVPRRWWSLHAPRYIVILLGCPWCISGWLSAGLTAIVAVFASAPLPLLWWLAQWRLGLLLYWLVEMLARFGVDQPIEIEVEP